MNGTGSEIRRVGKEVSVSPVGSKTMSFSSVPYGVPVTASAIRPTTMLSVLEYSYFDAGVKFSGSLRTQPTTSRGVTNPRGSFVACSANPSERV